MRLSVDVLMHEVDNSSIGLKHVDPSVGHCVGGEIITSKLFFELHSSRMDRIQWEKGVNCKCLLLSSPWHLEVEYLYKHRASILLGSAKI